MAHKRRPLRPSGPRGRRRAARGAPILAIGAGYSSLARLQQLPFSELKIDRSYVSNCHEDKVNAGLCETIAKLAQRFELNAVAEGIEKGEESETLQAIGCDIGKGYLFAKPIPKAQLIGIIRARSQGSGIRNQGSGPRHQSSAA